MAFVRDTRSVLALAVLLSGGGASVEEAAALRGPAQAGDLLVFQRELVVVRDLLVHADWLL